jgi:hypothetical protein
MGPGVGGAGSKKRIRLGIAEADLTAIFAAFGKAGDAQKVPDSPKMIVDYINKHGGIGGRQVAVVEFKADSSSDASTGGQQACAAFTQDNKVDVVLDTLGNDVLAACLLQKGIADFTTANWALDSVGLKQRPNVIQPSAMQVDRQIRGLLQISLDRKNLSPGDKLGVMVENCPADVRTYNDVVVPFAKQHGINVIQSSVKCVTNLVSDLGPVTNDVQRAVLSFNTSGVNHVRAVSAAEAFLLANFTTNASQQKYYPKYLLTSNAYPWNDSQNDSVIKYSDDALPNMTGAGYIPLFDVGSGARPATAAQRQRQADCTKADPTQYGATTQSSTGKPFTQAIFFSTCDALFTMKAALEAANLSFGYKDVAHAFIGLKQKGQVSAVLSGGLLTGPPTSLDGAGRMQPFAYVASANAWRYVDSPVPVT